MSSAVEQWKTTERNLASQGLTVHNVGDEIWVVADELIAALSELEGELVFSQDQRITSLDQLNGQTDRAEQAEVSIADLNGLMDMMRENAVDREHRIAELESMLDVVVEDEIRASRGNWTAEAILDRLRARAEVEQEEAP